MDSSNDAIIRPAAPADYEGMCRVLDETDALHRAAVPWLVQEPRGGTARSRGYFEPFFAGNDCAAFVAATPDAGIVGVALGLFRQTADFPVIRRARYVELDAIGVHAPHRRRGVGERLTHAIEAWARASGAEWVQLGVYDFNHAAQRFYEKLGYGAMILRMRKPL